MHTEIDHSRAIHFYAASSDNAHQSGINVDTTGAHVTGFWRELSVSPIDYTDYDCQGFYIKCISGSAVNAACYLLDVSSSVNGTDYNILVTDVMLEFTRVQNQAYNIYFPVPIPYNQRLFARIRNTQANSTFIYMEIILVDAPTPRDRYLSACETIGTDTTHGVGASAGRNDTGGSTVDPGATLATFGAWKELTAATAFPFRHATLLMAYLMNTTSGAYNWRIQVGIGAAGQEQVVWDGLTMMCNTATDRPYPYQWSAPFCGPAGSRICVRASSDGNDATDRLFQVAMYLFRDG